MGGGTPRASANRPPPPRSPLPVVPALLTVIPAQAGTAPHTHPHLTSPLSPIHPSPLPGGRLGGGWDAASERQPPSTTPIASSGRSCPTNRHSCAGRNRRLSRHSCAGRNPRPHRHSCAGRNPNNPEQPRTNLNKPERRQTPRPDRTTQKNHPESARSKKPRTSPHPLPNRRSCPSTTVAPAPLHRHSCAGRNDGGRAGSCLRRNDGGEGRRNDGKRRRNDGGADTLQTEAGGARRRRGTPAALWRSESRSRARPPAQSATPRGTTDCPRRGRR